MEYYKIMIVDDEEEVREAIKHTMNWENLGFEVVSTAENGEDALEKAESLVPDVVLTDIQMPFMDGLTFCHKLKEKMSNVKIVIFSGYDEFEYAKEAIKVEAEEYLLKPVDRDEIIHVFERLRVRLDEEMDQRKNLERLMKYYEESAPLLKEQFLMSALFHHLSETELMEYSNLYNDSDIEMEERYTVMVMSVVEEHSIKESPLSSRLLPLSIKTIAKEDLEKTFQCQLFNYLGTIIAVIQMKSTDTMNQVVLSGQRICKEANRVLGINLCAGVGRIYKGLARLHHSYEEAKTAKDYSTFLGVNQTIYIEDMENDVGDNDLVDEKLIDRMIHEIKLGTKENLMSAIEEFVNTIQTLSSPMLQMRVSYTEVMVRLLRLCKVYKLPTDIATKIEELLNKSSTIYSLGAVKEILEELSKQLQTSIREQRQDSSKILAVKAEEYIKDNYRDSGCTVEKVCHYIGVSSAYFALLFKKEIGMSFLSYLTKVRMEQAVMLLKTTQEKAYMIAGMVGYDEPNYFSYAFKKYYGISPARYRAAKSKEDFEGKNTEGV